MVVGGELVLQDDDAEVTVSRGDLNTAKSWLEDRGWHKKHGYAAAWARIRSMLT